MVYPGEGGKCGDWPSWRIAQMTLRYREQKTVRDSGQAPMILRPFRYGPDGPTQGSGQAQIRRSLRIEAGKASHGLVAAFRAEYIRNGFADNGG